MSKAKITKPKVIQDSQEDSSSQVPIVAAKVTKKQKVEEKKVVKKAVQPSSEEQEDTPVVQKKPTKQVKAEVSVAKKVVPVVSKKPVKKQSSDQEEESSEQKPAKVVAKVKSPAQKPVVAKKAVVQSSSEEQSQPVVKAKTTKAVAKVTSPVQKPVAKKPAKKVQSSSEQQSEEQVKKPTKVKSPVLKAKSPVQKAKSPVQKPLATKKKNPVSSEQEQEEQKPQPKKNNKKTEQVKMVDQDQEGQFQVCVRGLSFQAYDSDIRDFFNECGNITNVKLLTRDDGKSKGTAFVKFSKKSSFNAALELNGSEHLGRSLTIEQSQGKKTNNAGSFGGNNNRSYGQPEGNANIETPTLFIGGLSYNSTVESITAYFSQTGEIASARIVTDKQTGRPRGFGYVEFHDVDSAKKAYKELNGGNLDGRNIRLDSASQRDRPQGGERGGFGGGNRGSFGGNRGSFGGNRGGFGGDRGGFGGRGAPRNPGNSTVVLSQDDKNAKKGSIGTFAGTKKAL